MADIPFNFMMSANATLAAAEEAEVELTDTVGVARDGVWIAIDGEDEFEKKVWPLTALAAAAAALRLNMAE